MSGSLEQEAKSRILKELARYAKGTELNLAWNGRNGKLDGIVIFNGFNIRGPKLHFKEGGTRVDIEAIGGYKAITSLVPYQGVPAGVI